VAFVANVFALTGNPAEVRAAAVCSRVSNALGSDGIACVIVISVWLARICVQALAEKIGSNTRLEKAWDSKIFSL
jgi:hypothetical protein